MRHDTNPPRQPPLSFAGEVADNPGQARLREMALEHSPCCEQTSLGSINNVVTHKAGGDEHTHVIDGEGPDDSHGTLGPMDATALIEGQAAYIERRGALIAVDGYLGLGPRSVPVQWLYTLEGSSIAAMQQVLAFPREAVEDAATQSAAFRPAFRVFCTPGFFPEVPGRQATIVDLRSYTTYVMGTDDFSASRNAAFRMLCELVYRQGGLLLHAGAKAILTRQREAITMAVLGVDGTGKTTTTFGGRGDAVYPAQDDMIAIWPDGDVSVTENGCFARTSQLTASAEPVLHGGACHASAWLQNVYVDTRGRPDFSRTWTEDGRAVIPMRVIENVADLHALPPLASLGILNRDAGRDAATPGIVRFLDPGQATAYLMLGETTEKTAANEAARRTRSPFAQPLFPLPHRLQATRFCELALTSFPETATWMMNTGYVGGSPEDIRHGQGMKVGVHHSSAILQALVSNAITWTRDPDFGYEVVDVDAPANGKLLQEVPAAILQPRRFFADHGRGREYREWVARMKRERTAFLRGHGVGDAIASSVSL